MDIKGRKEAKETLKKEEEAVIGGRKKFMTIKRKAGRRSKTKELDSAEASTSFWSPQNDNALRGDIHLKGGISG